MLGGGTGAADAGPHPHRHHRPARGRPPPGRPDHQALVLIVVLVVVEVGEQGLKVAVAEGPDGHARRLLVAGGPQVVGVGWDGAGIGHGWPPSLWLAGGPLRAASACWRLLVADVGGVVLAGGGGG